MNGISIIYLSTALSDDLYNRVVETSKSFKPTFSGVGFDRNIAVGLSRYADIQGVSRYPIPSWPKYMKVCEKQAEFQIGDYDCFVPSMVNIPIIKESSYCSNCLKHLETYPFVEKNPVVVISGLYRSLLKPASILKKKYGLRVCAIVPDIPKMMIGYRNDYSVIRKQINHFDIKSTERYYQLVDGFVFLSKYMNEAVNLSQKPSIIVDGITDISVFPVKDAEQKEHIVLYAGKVSSTFGVDKLIEAFIQSKLPDDIKLHICGDGDFADELRNISRKNSRIVYHGAVSHDEVLVLEVNAALLVDPRPSDMELVKMSFPSKIIEYMASGTPVLTTNLPCFDDEYKKYQYRIDDESVAGITRAMERVFSKSADERNRLGEAARAFVLQNKTIDSQCKRIVEFLSVIEGN